MSAHTVCRENEVYLGLESYYESLNMSIVINDWGLCNTVSSLMVYLKSNIWPLTFYYTEGIVWKRLLFSEESNRGADGSQP